LGAFASNTGNYSMWMGSAAEFVESAFQWLRSLGKGITNLNSPISDRLQLQADEAAVT